MGIRERLIQFIFSKVLFYKLLVFGYPLIVHQLGKYVINQSDRLYITKMISVDEAGVYSIGYQAGSMIFLTLATFSNFFAPFVYERLASITELKKREIVKMSYVFAALIMVCYIAIQLITPYFFELLIDPKFIDGIKFVSWVSLAYVFGGFYMLFSAVIFYKEKTKFLGWLSLVNVVLNLGLNYWFILTFGSIEAAYATACRLVIIFAIRPFTVIKYIRCPGYSFFIKKVDKTCLSEIHSMPFGWCVQPHEITYLFFMNLCNFSITALFLSSQFPL